MQTQELTLTEILLLDKFFYFHFIIPLIFSYINYKKIEMLIKRSRNYLATFIFYRVKAWSIS